MKRIFKILCLVMIAISPAYADTTTCNGVVRQYESATGTVTQNGTPTPTNPITPTFYQQGDMVLRKVGDVADSYDSTTGKITRRIGVKVLDGTVTWTAYSGIFGLYYSEDAITDNNTSGASALEIMSNQYLATDSTTMEYNNTIRFQETTSSSGQHPVISHRLYIRNTNYATATAFKQYFTEQYNAGTPVTVYYPLTTPVEEDWAAEQCENGNLIKIATTKYTEDAFAGLMTTLESAITKVTNIVDTTVQQATEIGNLATTKQDRPETDCPAGRKCLLIMGADNKPHWYLIQE